VTFTANIVHTVLLYKKSSRHSTANNIQVKYNSFLFSRLIALKQALKGKIDDNIDVLGATAKTIET
jgi:hypothetical protein